MKQITLQEVLTNEEVHTLVFDIAEKGRKELDGLINKPVNQITLAELRYIGAIIKGTQFAYESDTVKALKKLYNAITQTF